MIKTKNPRPNIIWLSVDDVGYAAYDALGGAWGPTSPHAKQFRDVTGPSTVIHTAPINITPNLNRMLRSGVSFDSFIVSNQCGSTRGMLSTGHVADLTGVGPLNPSAPIDNKLVSRRIADDTDYVIYAGGKSQFGTKNCGPLNYPTSGSSPSNFPWPLTGESQAPGSPMGLDAGTDFCVGEQGLSYEMEFTKKFPVLTRNSAGGYDSSAWTPPATLGLTDGYMHVDEMMTYHSIESIKETAYARPDGSAGDPQSLWDNHYNKPFFINLGYHVFHGDVTVYKGTTSPQGYTTIRGNDKRHYVGSAPTIRGIIEADNPSYNPPRWSNSIRNYADANAGDWPLTQYSGLGREQQGAAQFTSNLFSCGPDWDDGDFTSSLWDTASPWLPLPGNNKASTLGPWQACRQGQSIFIDNQIGHYIKALGSAGMQNTLIMFTGDNGSSQPAVSQATNYPFGTDPVFVPDDADWIVGPESISGVAIVPNLLNTGGKLSVTETGFHVPLVVMGGWLNRATYGSRASKRLNGADIAETLSQLMNPKSTPVTPDGRDFSQLLQRDCHSGNCDTIADTPTTDWTYTAMPKGAGYSYKRITDVSGTHQYSMYRQNDGSGCELNANHGGPIPDALACPTDGHADGDRCDWVIDLLSDTPWLNLRSNATTAIDHPSLPSIYSELSTRTTLMRSGAGSNHTGNESEGGTGC